MRDPYVYPKSEVLINKPGITEDDKFKEVEANYTSMRISNIIENPPKGKFDFKHLCYMHYYIFQDIYEWAGQPRIINIIKPEPALGNISIEYSEFQDIKKDTTSVLSQMRAFNWNKISLQEKPVYISKLMAELWKVHPFREGNTRTILTFFGQYAESRGMMLDMDLFADNSAYTRTALVAASAVFKDIGDKSKPEYLIKIVKDSLERGSQRTSIKEKLNRSDKRSEEDNRNHEEAEGIDQKERE